MLMRLFSAVPAAFRPPQLVLGLLAAGNPTIATPDATAAPSGLGFFFGVCGKPSWGRHRRQGQASNCAPRSRMDGDKTPMLRGNGMAVASSNVSLLFFTVYVEALVDIFWPFFR